MGGSDHRRELLHLISRLGLEPGSRETEVAVARLLSKLTKDDVTARTVRSWIDKAATRRCPGWPVAILKCHLDHK